MGFGFEFYPRGLVSKPSAKMGFGNQTPTVFSEILTEKLTYKAFYFKRKSGRGMARKPRHIQSTKRAVALRSIPLGWDGEVSRRVQSGSEVREPPIDQEKKKNPFSQSSSL